MIEAVIFDMDGLLIDSESATYHFYKETCSKYGKNLEKKYYETLLGTNQAYIKKDLGVYLGDQSLALKVIQEVHDSLETYFQEVGVPLKIGVEELIQYLKEKGIKIAVATSSSRVRAQALLQKSGILGAFDAIVCGDEVTHSKPHPEIFLKAAAAIATSPSKTLVLEDSENGIIGAVAGGMACINVPDLKPPSDVVLLKANHITRNLLEVIELFDKID